MKILCNACEAAEATLLCCADEAALCVACDRDVHAANKLAGKHQRLPLLAPAAAAGASGSAAAAAAVPKCDICQENSGYFFCLEDRALLCRNCDVAIHTGNTFVSAHRRFLVTGVQVGLEFSEPAAPIAKEQLNHASAPPGSATKSFQKQSRSMSLCSENSLDQVVWPSCSTVDMAGNLPDWCIVDEPFNFQHQSVPKKSPRGSAADGNTAAFSNQVGKDGGMTNRGFSSGGLITSSPDWPLDEFFGFPEFSNNSFGFSENGTSKADSAKFGSSEGSPNYRSTDEDRNANDFFGQVPEIPWTVPELPSPPTASGLHWQRNPHRRTPDNASFVPDICSSETPFCCFTTSAATKRRRR